MWSFESKRHGAKEIVTSVAFIDDGSGMVSDMARYALSWGGGTHFDEPGYIGRFGFGLPNSSINQTLRTEVYTRTEKSEKITKAWLDATEVPNTASRRFRLRKPANCPSSSAVTSNVTG